MAPQSLQSLYNIQDKLLAEIFTADGKNRHRNMRVVTSEAG